MSYIVVRHFTDLLDSNHKYIEGDVYPREGYTPSPVRIAQLSSENNKQKCVLIEAIPEKVVITETVEISAEEEPTQEDKTIEEEKPKKKRTSKK